MKSDVDIVALFFWEERRIEMLDEPGPTPLGEETHRDVACARTEPVTTGTAGTSEASRQLVTDIVQL